MIRTIIALATFAGGGCAPVVAVGVPPVPATQESPPPKPPCQGEVVLLQHFDDPTTCDVRPPQMLVVRIDEMQTDFDRCHQYGGVIMSDNEVPALYCLGIDY